MKRVWLVVFGLALAGVVAMQWRTIASLRTEIAELRTRVDNQVAAGAADRPRPTPERGVSLGTLPQRVTQLEEAVGHLSRTSELLAERGITPPNAAHLA